MKISIVIPMYNEEAVIEETVKALISEMNRLFSSDYEILFSDDGSSDRTRELLSPYLSEKVKLISGVKNHGKGFAVRSGVLCARGDYIFFTDCDLAYGTGYFAPALQKMEAESLSVLVGSRAAGKHGFEGYGFLRKTLSRMYFRFLSFVGGLSVSDSQTGFKGFRRDAAREIFSRCEVDSFAFDFEALLLAKKFSFSVGELPVKVQNNRPSSIRFVRDSVKMVRDVLRIKKRLKGIKM